MFLFLCPLSLILLLPLFVLSNCYFQKNVLIKPLISVPSILLSSHHRERGKGVGRGKGASGSVVWRVSEGASNWGVPFLNHDTYKPRKHTLLLFWVRHFKYFLNYLQPIKNKSSGPSKTTSSQQITNNLYLCLAKCFKMNDWKMTAYLGGHHAIPSFGGSVELAVLTAARINF